MEFRIARIESAFEARNAKTEILEFIPNVFRILLMSCLCQRGVLVVFDAPRLAVPNVECAPITEAKMTGHPFERPLGRLATNARFCKGLDHAGRITSQ
jgi:hypothetical protein